MDCVAQCNLGDQGDCGVCISISLSVCCGKYQNKNVTQQISFTETDSPLNYSSRNPKRLTLQSCSTVAPVMQMAESSPLDVFSLGVTLMGSHTNFYLQISDYLPTQWTHLHMHFTAK